MRLVAHVNHNHFLLFETRPGLLSFADGSVMRCGSKASLRNLGVVSCFTNRLEWLLLSVNSWSFCSGRRIVDGSMHLEVVLSGVWGFLELLRWRAVQVVSTTKTIDIQIVVLLRKNFRRLSDGVGYSEVVLTSRHAGWSLALLFEWYQMGSVGCLGRRRKATSAREVTTGSCLLPQEGVIVFGG